MGDSSPLTSPTPIPPMGCSSSQTAPAWVPSMGCSPSGTGCSSMGRLRGHKPCQQTCSRVGFSLHEVHRSCQEPALARALHGVTACLTMVCSTGCRGTPAPAPGAPPPLPSSLALVSAELFLPHSLTPLSCCRLFFFFSLL